jgi:single-strand DNA-binding protein
MSAVNKVILLGNLGKDPEVRHLENDRIRATFALATNETYKNKAGEKITTTEWHNIVLWASLAKIAEQYLTKGKQVYIEGKLTTRSYVDKEGQVKYTTEVVGQNLVLLGGRQVGIAGAVTDQGEDVSGVVEDESLDGLPF